MFICLFSLFPWIDVLAGNLCWSGPNMWAEGPSINQPLSLIPLMHLTLATECWLVRQTLFCDLIGWCWAQLKIHSVDHRSPPLQTGDRSVLFIKSGPDQGQQEIRFVFCRRIYKWQIRHDFLEQGGLPNDLPLAVHLDSLTSLSLTFFDLGLGPD